MIAEIAPVYRKDAQEGAELVLRAQAEQLTVSELRALKSGSERVSVKRWTLAELRERLVFFIDLDPDRRMTAGITLFLEWLEEEGA